MNEEFVQKLHEHARPVVVDFWAPWCVPCRAIEPVMEKLGEEYTRRVDVWKVNADEQPELVHSLRIYSIPTLIAFRDGQEVGRHTGAASAPALAALFESAMNGEKLARNGIELSDRFLRLGAGLALVSLAILGGLTGTGLLVASLGAAIMFSGVYDRCPIYRMVSMRLKEIIQRQ
jgi:thioredoxin